MKLLVPAMALLALGVPADPSAVERTPLDELKKLLKADKVLVVDVRSADSYRMGHIPGSVSAPLTEIEKHVEELKSPKKAIVTYCT